MGVTATSKTKEIRKAYFDAAKKYHPDVTAKLDKDEQEKANNKYLLISQAYEILSNKTKRKLYDEERAKRNYGDPNTLKADFYKNVLRRAHSKGVNLNKFETEEQALKWWKEEQRVERQSALREWRRKIKQKPMSAFQDYYYMDLMNKNIMNAKEKLVVKNALISIFLGFGFYAFWQYITSDTNLTFSQFYIQSSPFLQQIINRVKYGKNMFSHQVESNKLVLDTDGNWKHTVVNRRSHENYDHSVDVSHSLPPSLRNNE